MSANPVPRIPSGSTPMSAAEVLKGLEARAASVRVSLTTEIGSGEVDVIDGRIVDAHFGDLFGKPALLALIGVTEARFTVTEQAGEPRPALCEGVSQLLEERAQRMAEWRRLSDLMPPLDSILRVVPGAERRLSDRAQSGEERRLVTLLNDTRNVLQVVGESGMDAVDALRTLLDWLGAGLVERTSSSGTSRSPVAPAAPVPVRPQRTLDVEAARESGRSNPLRRKTVIGIGLPAPEPVKPRRVEVHRSISVGPAPTGTTTPPPPAATTTPTHGGIGIASPAAAAAAAAAAAPAPAPAPVLSPAAPAQGQRSGSTRAVGRYELVCRLGQGGMGAVYLGRMTSETGFSRLFAVKLLRRHLVNDREAARDFMEEARLAGRLHHPNVVSVIDAGISEDQPYLVMEYVEGCSLKQLLTGQTSRRHPQLIVPVILDALAGLHAAHELTGDDGLPLSVVHCDVSPENLLVGTDGVCRVTDFGVARRGTANTNQQLHGKPGYLAPEQVWNHPIDRRADLFALGIVLYNSLTGVRLFEGGSPEETMRRVTSLTFDPPSSVGLHPPPCLDFVCMKALDRDPARRYATAEEMLTELRRVALREELLAAPAAVAAWVRDTVRADLDQRRLALLDATRGRTMAAGAASPQPHGHPAPAPAASVPPVPMSYPGDGGKPESTIPIPIDITPRPQRWLLIAVAVLAFGTILGTLAFPGRVSRLFRINTSGARSEGIRVDVDAGASATPSTDPLPLPSQAPTAGDPPSRSP